MGTEFCLFCREETGIEVSREESTSCPVCGVTVIALPALPEAAKFWQLAAEGSPEWEARITVKEGLFLVFLWDPEEGLPTTQVAEILAHSDVRAVSNLIRNNYLPNTRSVPLGEKSVRYYVPRKDVYDHMNRKAKAQKPSLE
jgi:hypothetical protein